MSTIFTADPQLDRTMIAIVVILAGALLAVYLASKDNNTPRNP